MDEDLRRRLDAVASGADEDELLDLGSDLADAGLQVEAERCFRRAAELGSTEAMYDLGNTLRELGRVPEAVEMFERAGVAGETAAWLNLGHLFKDHLHDSGGATWAYRAAATAGDVNGALCLAYELDGQGERGAAEQAAREAVALGNAEAVGLLAAWRWNATLDPALEPELRAGADTCPDARSALADLLQTTGRIEEARRVLEHGAELGELASFLPLGNLLSDVFGDDGAAEDAYRRGIALGCTYSHNNLGVLLAERGDRDGAQEQFRLGAENGDVLADRHLRQLLDESDSGLA